MDILKECSVQVTSPPYYEGFNSLRSETIVGGDATLAHRSPQHPLFHSVNRELRRPWLVNDRQET